jgi:hypothetical protein
VRRATSAACVALIALLLPLASGAAKAQTAAPAPVQFGLLQQPAWSTLGSDVPIRLLVSNVSPGLEVRATIHQQVGSRIAFERTITGTHLGTVLDSAQVPVALLPPSPSGGRIFTMHLGDPSNELPGRLSVPLPEGQSAAVYPVEFELRDPTSGNRVAGFVTHLVGVAPHTPEPIGSRLDVAWIWRIASPPAMRPSGAMTAGFSRAVSPGGRLDTIARSLASARNVPITLAPGPETMQAWATFASTHREALPGLDAVRATARSHEVMTAPFVPIDGPSLESGGLGDASSHQLSQGNQVLDDVLDTEANAHVTTASPLDSAYLARLSTALVDHIVTVPSALAQGPEDQFTPARPFELQTGGTSFTAAQTDPGLETLLTSGAGTDALRAERFLSALAVVALEQPNLARGVVVSGPLEWNPTAGVLSAVLAGLRGNPLLAPASIDTFFDVPVAQSDGQPEVRELAPTNPSTPPVRANDYVNARHQLDGLESTLPESSPIAANGERALLSSVSSSNTRNQASAQLGAISASVHAIASGIHAPTTRTVTLTSKSAQIPVSLLNDTAVPLTVLVSIDSAKLQFPNGSEQTVRLPPGRNVTQRFTVEARASGTFPLHISIATADGAVRLQQAQYTVRSTFVSGVGLFLTIGAAVFLAAWWITHWRKSRRRATPALAT